MEHPQKLAATFHAHAKAPFLVQGDAAELEHLLRRAFESARTQWPTVALPAEEFVRHLAEQLPKTGQRSPVERFLAQLSLTDLYLACACACGVPEAIATFERHYLAKLPRQLGHLKLPSVLIEDVCQMVREKFLVRTDEGGPHIATYAGKGQLQNFVYVIGVRFARKLRDANAPAPEVDKAATLEVLSALGANPEMDFIKRSLDHELRPAFRAACSMLSSQERRLLQLHYVRKLSTPKLGVMFGVNQSTASRWLENVREKIRDETKRLLQERLGLSPRDLESFLADLSSRLDLSLSQILGKEDDGQG